jgi:F0F1-type ATP synthase assembly protein I
LDNLKVLMYDVPSFLLGDSYQSFKLMSKNNGLRQGMQIAFRLGTELTVATFFGALLGYGLDRLLGIRPWGLAVGVILGGAAGCLNVYRAAMLLDMKDDDYNNS